MSRIIRKNFPLLIIVFFAVFVYTYRVRDTFVMAGDTARDLIDMITIWQNKTITAVGEPVNTISNNPIQVLFGSYYLYLGILGLILFRFDPAGSIFINLLLTIISIFLFYLLSLKLLKNRKASLIATFIYCLSPVTVLLTRSLWEPNIVLPLAVIAWFFFLYRKNNLDLFMAGIVTGIIFNIHYMNFIPFVVYYLWLLFKSKKQAIISILGMILASLPLIFFEIRNNFYLINAFIGTFGGFSTFSERTINPFLGMDIFLYIFGLGPYQYFISELININFPLRMIINTTIGIFFIYYLVKRQKFLKPELVAVIISGLLTGWFFERWHLLALRYMLSVYVLLIIVFTAFLSEIKSKLVYLLLIPMLFLSLRVITHRLDPTQKEDYYPIPVIEAISHEIVSDNPSNYNITENILGDARSLALRYFLLRDASQKPQPVEIYDRITTLYVLSPSLERIYSQNRWEFNASGPKRLTWEKTFGDLKLFKFVK